GVDRHLRPALRPRAHPCSNPVSSTECPTRFIPTARLRRSCPKGYCVSARSPNCAITSRKVLKARNVRLPARDLRGRGKRRTGVGADAFHHRAKAVGSLRSEMFAQAHTFE